MPIFVETWNEVGVEAIACVADHHPCVLGDRLYHYLKLWWVVVGEVGMGRVLLQ